MAGRPGPRAPGRRVTDRSLVFVSTAQDAPPPRQGAAVVVLDATWTPTLGDQDLIAARQVLGRVVERVDLFADALELVDRWAATSGIADTLTVEGTTYWYRLRETMWRWLHERMLWHAAIADLERQGAIDGAELLADEPALADVMRLRWPAASLPSSDPQPAVQRPEVAAEQRRSLVARIARRLLGTATSGRPAPVGEATAVPERERRETILAARAEALAKSPRPRVIVLTNPGTHQRIGAPGGDRQDPLFGAVIPDLAERGYQPILLATGVDHRQDDDWPLVADDDRLLPQYLLMTRWSGPADEERVAAALERVETAIDRAGGTRLVVDGLDLSAPFVDALRAAATQIVKTDVRMLARIERLIEELGPSAILLAQEGIRTPWLMAGQRAGIPVVAVQHGVLYAGHAGYPNRRHEALCLPARTCVYGSFERDVLLHLAYEADEVVVTGSPRLDLDVGPGEHDVVAGERAAVRRELGVAEADRLLLVSTINLRFVQRSHFAHMLEAVLGAPLPHVHVVFKQHPGERDEGPYRDLLLGLARAAGYTPPPISVVKDVDLYRLLRAADAHLGLLSTVLTEAVVTATPNLIAITDAHTDLLGYVEAGVARPVRTTADLLAALDASESPDPKARQAFLDRHFMAGDASGRVIDVVSTSIGAPAPEAVA
jgi:hypothetical protein